MHSRGLIMAGWNNEKNSGNWGVKNGPGFLLLFAVAALVATILIWRSGLPWRVSALVFCILLIVFLLFIGQMNSITFDTDRRMIFIRQQRIWQRSDREIPFDRIENVAVLTFSSGSGNRNHCVNLVLKSGEIVRITAHPGSGKLPKKKLAQRISDTLNQFRSQPITPALDGIVQVVREGNTNGIPWSINMITVNDSTPITQWICQALKFNEGFLLCVPAKNTNLSAAGELSKSSRFFYEKYLQNLMLAESQIPNLEGAVLLRPDEHLLGNDFACISNDPSSSISLITESLADKIKSWIEEAPLTGKKGETQPHILFTKENAILCFRKLYYQDDEIEHIAEFGVSLRE